MVNNKLKEIRLKSEMTQVALAKAVNVSRQTIHSIEVMKYVPSVELALNISHVFKLKVEDLFKIKGDKK